MEVYTTYTRIMHVLIILVGFFQAGDIRGVSSFEDITQVIEQYNELRFHIKEHSEDRLSLISRMRSILNTIEQFYKEGDSQELTSGQLYILTLAGFAPHSLPLKRMVLESYQIAHTSQAVNAALTPHTSPGYVSQERTPPASDRVIHNLLSQSYQELCQESRQESLQEIYTLLEQDSHRISEHPRIVQYRVLSQEGDLARSGTIQDGISDDELEKALLAQHEHVLSGNTCASHALKNALCLLTLYKEPVCQQEKALLGEYAHAVREYTQLSSRILMTIAQASHELIDSVRPDTQTLSSEEVVTLLKSAAFAHCIQENTMHKVRPEDIHVIGEVFTLEAHAALGADVSPESIDALQGIETFVRSADDTRAFMVLLQDSRNRVNLAHWITVIAHKKAGVPIIIIADSNQGVTHADLMQRAIYKELVGRLQGIQK